MAHSKYPPGTVLELHWVPSVKFMAISWQTFEKANVGLNLDRGTKQRMQPVWSANKLKAGYMLPENLRPWMPHPKDQVFYRVMRVYLKVEKFEPTTARVWLVSVDGPVRLRDVLPRELVPAHA